MIDVLDIGENKEFNPAKINSIEYGIPISKKNWEYLEVKDSNFFRAQPVCAFGVPEGSKVVVFGG